jgi:signal transduction histidine kinase/ligand-binding sensor domain-containing protein
LPGYSESMRLKLNLILVYLFLANSLYISGQQFDFRNWSLEDGLPQSEVYAMLQDSRGIIWVGSNGGGLSRFNGVSFRTYTTRDGLISNMVWALYEDSRGNIWIGSSNSVSVFNGISFTNYTEAPVPFLRTYNIFHEDSDSNIWIVSFDEQSGGRLLKIQDNILTDYSSFFPELSNANRILASFSVISKDILYLSTANGLYELRNNKLIYSDINKFVDLNDGIIVPVFYDSLGGQWTLKIRSRTNRDLYTFKNDSLLKFRTPASSWWKGITAVYRDRHNRLWLSNLGTGIAVIDLASGKITQFDQRNGLPNDYVLNFMEDHEGNIWMGTQGGGIIQYIRNKFIAFNFESIINGDVVRTIFQDSDGNWWFGLSSAGIVKYNGSRFISFTKGQFPALVNVRDIIELENKNLLILTFNGLYIYDGNHLSFANQKYGLNSDLQFTNAIQDEDTLWLATQGNGVFRINNRASKQFSIDNGSLKSNQIHSLYKDKAGNIWICTNNGISRYSNGDITSFTTDNGLNSTITLQITEDLFGRYWIASFSGGINILDDGQFSYLTSEKGLSSNIIYSILTDKQGNIWAGTQNGVDEISFDAYGKISSIQHFGSQDGFTGIENNGAANLIDRDGNLWFGTVKGAMRYDPNIIELNRTAPVVQITDVKLFFREVDWRDSAFDDFRSGVQPWNAIPENLVFPHDSNHLSFIFEALSFMAPEKVRYQWKLEGLDKDWSPVSSKTEAIYPEIPPGDYAFLVRAMNNDGIWSPEPASFAFKIQPPWWKSSWFIIIASLLALVIFASVIQLRVRIIKAKKEELEELVREKTLEVVNKNQLLEQQKEEIQVQADNLQKSYNNLERLSEIGKIITSQLTVEKIVDAAYDSINELMDATVFGIGIINETNNTIDFYGVKEKGETIDFLSFTLNDDLRLSVYCVNHKKEIFIHDFETEFAKYLPAITPSGKSGNSSSIIYLPLIQDKKPIGVITVQSFQKNAYSEYHLSILRNLAVYTKIALENTDAYKKIQEQADNLIKANEDISKKNIEIAKANDELIELNNEKNNLIGILAHDLRNPLTSSLSIASNLESTFNNLKKDDRTSINFLVGALNRMNDMISKILDIRMIEQKKINLNCERMNFEEVLQEVIGNFKPAAASKKIKIYFESNKIYGIADRNYLIQVFENLLSNAIKFSPPNKKVWARLDEQDGDIRISFTDEGPGLTADDIKKLFKPFQRLSTQPTAGEKSIGLGLSIVKKYVDLMDGRIWCESEPGKGANFIVTFHKS